MTINEDDKLERNRRRARARFVALFVLAIIWFKVFSYLSSVAGDGAGHTKMPPADLQVAIAPLILLTVIYIVLKVRGK